MWSCSDDVGDDGSDGIELPSLPVPPSIGVFGGWVGNVWYRWVEPRRIIGAEGTGAPAWYDPDDVRPSGGGRGLSRGILNSKVVPFL